MSNTTRHLLPLFVLMSSLSLTTAQMSFGDTKIIDTEAYGAGSVAIADMNNDGLNDMLMVGEGTLRGIGCFYFSLYLDTIAP